jgi:hypothetical protein
LLWRLVLLVRACALKGQSDHHPDNRSSHLDATPADLVRWLRLPCAPVLKSPRMFRDAEEWSQDHSGALANFASERA